MTKDPMTFSKDVPAPLYTAGCHVVRLMEDYDLNRTIFIMACVLCACIAIGWALTWLVAGAVVAVFLAPFCIFTGLLLFKLQPNYSFYGIFTRPLSIG